jgi:hypothetical protein
MAFFMGIIASCKHHKGAAIASTAKPRAIFLAKKTNF